VDHRHIQSSSITQTGSGSTARLGINITTPASTLDVNGAETVRGKLGIGGHRSSNGNCGKKLATGDVHCFSVQQHHWRR